MGALIGRGGSDGDIQRALKVEAGQCALKIAQQLGPKSTAEAKKNLLKDMRSHLSIKPTYSNLSESQQYSSTNNFTWLYAGNGFIAGINDEDDFAKSGSQEVLEVYYANRKLKPRGAAWINEGSRRGKGTQKVMRLNRIRVSKASFAFIRKSIQNKFGQSKAAWLAASQKYLMRKRIPAWVKAQIETVIQNGKSILEDHARGLQPFIVIGSRAAGVEKNAKIRSSIQAGIISSQAAIKSKADKIISGQTYNWNTGAVFSQTKLEEN